MTIFISYHIYTLIAGAVRWGSTGAVLGAATSRAGAARQTDRPTDAVPGQFWGGRRGLGAWGGSSKGRLGRVEDPALREDAANPRQGLGSCPGAKGTGGGLGAFPHFSGSVSVHFAAVDVF